MSSLDDGSSNAMLNVFASTNITSPTVILVCQPQAQINMFQPDKHTYTHTTNTHIRNAIIDDYAVYYSCSNAVDYKDDDNDDD